jgi:hypothetical protein
LLTITREEVNDNPKAQATSLEQVNGRKDNIGENFLKFVEQSNKFLQGYAEQSKRWRQEIIDVIHKDNNSHAKRGGETFGKPKEHLREILIASLKFKTMEDRHERIVEAYEKTFEWIFNDPDPEPCRKAPWINFSKWLESSSSLYWITGKAGSGKSTLIKYIYEDPRTAEHLERWATEGNLATAAHFFWNSGTDMQMSRMGLMQSLLHQILSACPALTSLLFPKRWEAYCLFGDDPCPLTETELKQSFRLIREIDPSVSKFCIFIDGLDEFDGEHGELVAFIEDLSLSPNTMLCVSSRPWLVFEDAFKRGPSLMVQDLTYPDIIHFIRSKFLGDLGFAELQKRETEYAAQLLEDIAQKAAGVFLWVHLVVNSLFAGLSNGDRVSDLQKRLSFLPPDLESLYQKILDNLDPFYLEHASQIFELVKVAHDRPSILCMSLADEELDLILKVRTEPFSVDKIKTKADVMMRRLNSRCKGLLEVASGLDYSGDVLYKYINEGSGERRPLPSTTVQYLHRTVKDFLENSKNWKWLLASRRDTYDPNLALSKSFLAQLKGTHPQTITQTSLIAQCLFYAKRAENLSCGSLLAILDDLDRTAEGFSYTHDNRRLLLEGEVENLGSRLLFQHFIDRRQSYNLKHPWTSDFTFSPSPSFISLAVRLYLYEYVRTKIRPGCLVKQENGVWPLLYYAIAPSVLDKQLSTVDRFPNKRIVKLLLDNGADPNRIIPHKKMKVWETLLRESHDQPAALDTWLDIVPDFLANGADPRMITTCSRDLQGVHVGAALVNFRPFLRPDYLYQTPRWYDWNKTSSQIPDITEDDIKMIKSHPSRHTHFVG